MMIVILYLQRYLSLSFYVRMQKSFPRCSEWKVVSVNRNELTESLLTSTWSNSILLIFTLPSTTLTTSGMSHTTVLLVDTAQQQKMETDKGNKSLNIKLMWTTNSIHYWQFMVAGFNIHLELFSFSITTHVCCMCSAAQSTKYTHRLRTGSF